MKLQWLAALAVAALIGAPTGALAAKIVVEAEHCRAITPSMVIKADTTASGGKCIERPLKRPHATTETGPSDTGNAEYKIRVATAGVYQFWGRCWWQDACGNSFSLLMDTTAVTARTPYITDQLFRKWHWVAGPTFNLSAGAHVLRIQYREDGTRMDQWLLTTTPRNRWEPSRVETETPQAIMH